MQEISRSKTHNFGGRKQSLKGSKDSLSFEKNQESNSAYIVDQKTNAQVQKQLELIDQEVQVDNAALKWFSKGSGN